MQAARKKMIALLICFVFVTLMPGCTNWQKKYDALLVEHENLKGLRQGEMDNMSELADKFVQGQQTIEELRRQIEEQKKTPADASGFGEGYDVAFDPTAGTVTVTLENSLLFDSGKATLKKSNSSWKVIRTIPHKAGCNWIEKDRMRQLLRCRPEMMFKFRLKSSWL